MSDPFVFLSCDSDAYRPFDFAAPFELRYWHADEMRWSTAVDVIDSCIWVQVVVQAGHYYWPACFEIVKVEYTVDRVDDEKEVLH